MDKPADVFDRDFEWAELTRFARYSGTEATLGVISGRRRQGKTFLLDAVTRACGGFMFTATETTEADALRQFGEALARHRDEPVPFRFARWDEAIGRVHSRVPLTWDDARAYEEPSIKPPRSEPITGGYPVNGHHRPTHAHRHRWPHHRRHR